MTHCPNCGTAARPGTPRCTHCNYKWPQLPTAPETANQISCWNCRHPNTPQHTRCEACNVYLSRPQEAGQAAPPTSATPHGSLPKSDTSGRPCVVLPLVHPFTLSYVQ